MNKARTITERLAKRIRRGQPIPPQSVSNETILGWARQYGQVRRAQRQWLLEWQPEGFVQ